MFEVQSSTYTYLLADAQTKEAVIIDPVLETAERDLKLMRELGVKLVCILETHIHADHVTGASFIREKTGAKIALSRAAQASGADVLLDDGHEIFFGAHKLTVIATPGHTAGCLSYYTDGKVFTGDALFIRGTGRTDFQQGSAATLYDSITRRLFALPPDTEVYPAHDYCGQTKSTLALEKQFNPRVGGGKTQAEFVAIMNDLKLAPPKMIQIAAPANLRCGQSMVGKS